MDTLKSFFFEKTINKLARRKSLIVWENFIDRNNQSYETPICYLKKPKWMEKRDWDLLIENMNITINKFEQ
jgi:hypothetical protein